MNNFPLETYLHRFQRAPITPLPEVFNFPHQYEPHDWVIYAAQQLQEAIPNTFKHSTKKNRFEKIQVFLPCKQ
ncbi:MAG: hypothetical protein EB023_08680 [Flavobacteriia bacterium]|nr:hypothetical protein [Flavobacteriia bacterium]